MLNINPTQGDRIAASVQRDYRRAAENRRLVKESGSRMRRLRVIITAGSTLAIVTAALLVAGQLLSL